MMRKRALSVLLPAMAVMSIAATQAAATEDPPAPEAATEATEATPVPSARPAGTPPVEPPTNQVIVALQDPSAAGRAAAEATLSAAAGVALRTSIVLGDGSLVMQLPEARPLAEVTDIANRLSRAPGVAYAEPDAIAQVAATPNDALYNQQWHYKWTNTAWGANLEPAWNITTGAPVVVAVVDTGRTNHPDLAGKLNDGADLISNTFISRDGNGRDADETDPGDWSANNECGSGVPGRNSTWHGTHVAGTIGAATNNGTGVAGVSWGAKILHVRVLGRCGGNISDIADGIRWAAGLPVAGLANNPTPAKVINLSLGGSGACSATYQNAINAAVNAGAVLAIAAGNSAASANGFQPGNCNNVITVAAGDKEGNLASYSNFSTTVVEITAPGGETSPTPNKGVLSTLNAGTTSQGAFNYVFYQGTSMATPHVAGVLALMKGLKPAMTPAQLTTALLANTRPFKAGGDCLQFNDCGVGWLDAGRVITAINGGGGGATTFNSQFNANNTGWSAVNGTWTRGGGFYQSAGVANKSASAKYTTSFSSITYEVKMRRTGCTGCANRTIIRGNPVLDANGYWKPEYSFQYSNNGQFSVYKETAGGVVTAIKPWTVSGAVTSGWNVLKVVANGTSLKFYINGVLVWQGTDPTLASGKVGFGFYRQAPAGTLQVDYATGTSVAAREADEVVAPGTEIGGGSIDTTS